jgi:hypothetical protein
VYYSLGERNEDKGLKGEGIPRKLAFGGVGPYTEPKQGSELDPSTWNIKWDGPSQGMAMKEPAMEVRHDS